MFSSTILSQISEMFCLVSCFLFFKLVTLLRGMAEIFNAWKRCIIYIYIYIYAYVYSMYHKRCLYFVVIMTTPYTNNYLMITCIFWAFLSKHDKKDKTAFSEDSYSLNFVVVYHAIENTFTYF